MPWVQRTEALRKSSSAQTRLRSDGPRMVSCGRAFDIGFEKPAHFATVTTGNFSHPTQSESGGDKERASIFSLSVALGFADIGCTWTECDWMKEPPEYLSNAQAAELLNLSPRTLEKHRVNGGGPAFRKFGRRVLYSRADLDSWAADRRCRSTSDVNYNPRPRSQRA